jgi:hypothetical protein
MLPSMKRSFAIVVCLLSVLPLFSQKQSIAPQIRKFRNDTIVWHPDSLLTKENFKSKSKGKSGPLGFTCSGIFVYPSESGGALLFNVEALFVKSKSYLFDNSPYILKHEQLHFDICELYARKLRQKIAEADFKEIKNVNDFIRHTYEKINTEYTREQQKYDKDTEHGLNPAKQQSWSDDIHKRLTELNAYSETSINTVK